MTEKDTRAVLESLYSRVMTLQIVLESALDELYEEKIINKDNVDNRIREKTKEFNDIVEKLSHVMKDANMSSEEENDEIDISSLFSFGKNQKGEA